jgi:ATP-binding cassette subfamily C protein
MRAARDQARAVGTERSAVAAADLLAACRLVGAAAGVEVAGPPHPAHTPAGADDLHRIARRSGFRIRRVALDGEWWQEDSGPMLGYRRDGTPVALVRDRAGRYVVATPSGGPPPVVVTPQVADLLAPWAESFSRPFPEGMVTPMGLIRHGARGSRADLWRLILAGLLAGVLGIATPLATGWLVAELIPNGDREAIAWLALAVLATAAGVGAFTLVRDLVVFRIETRFDGAVGEAVWDRLLRLPVPFFRGFDAADLARRATGLEAVRQAVTGAAASAGLAFVFSVPSLILAWYLDPYLALPATVAIAVGLVCLGLTGAVHLRVSRRFLNRTGRLLGVTHSLIAGIPKLRVAGAEEPAFAVWSRAFEEQQAAGLAGQRATLGLAVVAGAVSRLTLAVVFLIAAFRGASAVSPAAFLAFYVALGQILAAVISLGSALSVVTQLVPSAERARPILETEPENEASHPGDREEPRLLTGTLGVDGITFAYQPGDPPIIDHVSFEIEAGKFVAIVGPSGAGKTTLLRLLLGFERPQIGSVRYDGRDLAELDLDAVRRQLGVVLQDATLLPGDIRANILGATALSLDDAWEAARLAGIDEEIRRMPMGIHTFVAEGGSALSAGQRQRILLARALVRRPRILLLDEATSALDDATQRLVMRSLRDLDITRVAIAHRLSTIADADLILVVDRGRIVQRGRYAALIDQPGVFQRMARRQLATWDGPNTTLAG